MTEGNKAIVKMQSAVVHISAIVFVLLVAVQNFATVGSNDITTEVPAANTPSNLANETELIDTTRLIMEYESTISANNESIASNSISSSNSGTTESHNSNSSTASSTSSTEPTVSTENKTMTPEEIQRLLLPPAKIEASILHLNTTEEVHEKIIKESDCPSLEEADKLSQTQLLLRLTHDCRYDRLERPMTHSDNGTKLPVHVYARAYIYFLQNLEAHDLQFKIHALLQFRYVDSRLVFKKVAPNRTDPIVGEQTLRDLLWVPHVFLANERSSDILGTAEKDILTSVSPDGTVIISTRISATLYCWMNLQKFPFDEQHCSTVLESWMYNDADLILQWEKKSPVTLAPELHLTEYVLLEMFTNETVINADLSDLRHGAFAGNYSSLSFTVHLAREMGFYLMDYFIPSIMLVTISWVTFWLQADQSAPRITLGTSTMLTFITLASAQGKTLPKVSYIKASEIWFLGCTGFIFGSLVEFAFVNTIWRRKKNVELKKKNSKYILKSITPLPSRKDFSNLHKSHSCTSLDGQVTATPSTNSFNNYLTVHSFPAKTSSTLPMIITSSAESIDDRNGNVTIKIEDTTQTNGQRPVGSPGVNPNGWTTMTPQEIAIWIDKRSRFVFPIAFLIFNIFYWSFVYYL
ncbi:pH-sensitive chloride channel 2-like isoform X2 [Toxorhynchites rutilus septentrionalis]|uniref:pH-sensitive chloride channel 2-like isoform X2 n=1 Tax=Toxorhynchites rutilus septentrionalis TaxID=329112 RepID=UPI00247A58BF|nr:pH-sensitive chloride channel 2-like isoform X2 [Toxorhynchites rutilus septentrionalis]